MRGDESSSPLTPTVPTIQDVGAPLGGGPRSYQSSFSSGEDGLLIGSGEGIDGAFPFFLPISTAGSEGGVDDASDDVSDGRVDGRVSKWARVLTGRKESTAALRSRKESKASVAHDDEKRPLLIGAPKRKVHWFVPFTNLWKTYIGSGIIALPYAYKRGGVAVAAAMLIWSSFVNNETMKLIYALRLRLDAKSFEHIGYLTYGRAGYLATVFSIITAELGFCSVYVVFIVKTLHDLYGEISIYYYGLIIFLPLLLLSLIPSLDRLMFVAVIGNFAMIAMIVVVLIFGFSRDTGGHKSMKAYDLAEIPFVFGIAAYTFAIQCVVIPNSENVKNGPKVFPRVMDATAILSCTQCVVFGFIGYWFFTDATGEMITENLPSGIFNTLTKACLVGVLAATFPLQMFIPASIVERGLLKPHSRFLFLRRALIRSTMVTGVTCLAIGIPFFSDLVSFVGAFSCSLIGFILPVMFYLKVFKDETSVGFILFLSAIFLLGFVGMVFGVATDAIGLYEKLRDLYFS